MITYYAFDSKDPLVYSVTIDDYVSLLQSRWYMSYTSASTLRERARRVPDLYVLLLGALHV